MADPKVWFITGTSKGFGRIWAEAALARGDKVAATARDASTLEALAEKYGDSVLTMALDVQDHDADFAAVKQAHEAFGAARRSRQQRRLRALRRDRGGLPGGGPRPA
jgi:NADP-dependent 3-hydroxy acid dehydrogenase YdfG